MKYTKFYVVLLFLMSAVAQAEIDERFNTHASVHEESYPNKKLIGAPVQSMTENPDVESQLEGKYPNLSRQESLPLGAIQHAWDHSKATAGVYQVNYNPREVVKLITREYMTTTVILPEWEKIDQVIVGDETTFVIHTPKQNILLIKPRNFVGVDSSITALGNSGLVYNFYVRSEGYNSDKISDLAVYLRVPMPKYAINKMAINNQQVSLPVKESKSSADKNDYLESVIFDPAQLDFNYTMAGEPSIAPERVYSDGLRTWFEYGDRIKKDSLPVIYALVDNVDTPINVNREGTKLVAQWVGSFTLRNGEKTTCVYPTIHKSVL